jgi:hypothetical protein
MPAPPRPAPVPEQSAPVAPEAAAHAGLPQRVPSQPDVPGVPATEPVVPEIAHANAPDLARIAQHLREDADDEPTDPEVRPDGFDIPSVIEAVRGVAGVRNADLRPNPGGVHTLRLELTDDADPGWVSRVVARLLNERMGLAAEPNLPDVPSVPAQGGSPARSAPVSAPAQPPSASPTSGVAGPRRRRPVSAYRRAEPRPPESEPEVFRPASQNLPARSGLPELPPGPAPVIGAAPVSGTAPGAHAGHPVQDGERDAIVSPRVVIDQVEVSTQGAEAIVEVRLTADGVPAIGTASGPSVDGYILRLSAVAAAAAIDEFLVDANSGTRGRCYIEHTALMQFGSCDVAVVVLLLMADGLVEQLTGSAVVSGDPRQAIVRATLAAVNRRLEGLLP